MASNQKMAIYCPQGSGTLRQQLLSMHYIAWYCKVLHGIAWYCILLHGIALFCIILHYLAIYARAYLIFVTDPTDISV